MGILVDCEIRGGGLAHEDEVFAMLEPGFEQNAVERLHATTTTTTSMPHEGEAEEGEGEGEAFDVDLTQMKALLFSDLSSVYETNVAEMSHAFLAVFKRPMFVQEFLRYRTKPFPRFLNRVAWESEFAAEKPFLTLLVNVISKVYADFTDQKLTEYDVVSRYLYLLSRAESNADTIRNYYAAVTEEIIATEGYRFAMGRKLRALHEERFQCQGLADVDVDYLMDKVRVAKLSLVDEALPALMRDYHTEVELLDSVVDGVYDKVVGRAPEPSELAEHRHFFRFDTTTDTATATESHQFVLDSNDPRFHRVAREVQSALVSSLEFHDVIKCMIRKEYAKRQRSPYDADATNHKEIANIPNIPSITSVVLYTILRRVLQCIDGLTHAERNLDIVASFVGAQMT